LKSVESCFFFVVGEKKKAEREKRLSRKTEQYRFGGQDGEPQTNAILLVRAENNLSPSPPDFLKGGDGRGPFFQRHLPFRLA
jgi:hypothetical protein